MYCLDNGCTSVPPSLLATALLLQTYDKARADFDSQLITAVDVLPGNVLDHLGVLDLVEESEDSAGAPIDEAMGDAACNGGGTREAFFDAGRSLVARVPGWSNGKHFPKEDFHIDLAAGSCTCPSGQVTRMMAPAGKRTDRAGRVYQLRSFQFDGAACRACLLRSQCMAATVANLILMAGKMGLAGIPEMAPLPTMPSSLR